MCTPPKKLEEYPPFTEGGPRGGPHRGFSFIQLYFFKKYYIMPTCYLFLAFFVISKTGSHYITLAVL